MITPDLHPLFATVVVPSSVIVIVKAIVNCYRHALVHRLHPRYHFRSSLSKHHQNHIVRPLPFVFTIACAAIVIFLLAFVSYISCCAIFDDRILGPLLYLLDSEPFTLKECAPRSRSIRVEELERRHKRCSTRWPCKGREGPSWSPPSPQSRSRTRMAWQRRCLNIFYIVVNESKGSRRRRPCGG